ncbi:hypothetical protein SDC9_181865 [bioreactor metagenome]|uniref:Uncharacterized protein n=1 Tax=bioreactor metagenome TaxID=1076179 RepID=A0A645H7M9_9ZZZZ
MAGQSINKVYVKASIDSGDLCAGIVFLPKVAHTDGRNNSISQHPARKSVRISGMRESLPSHQKTRQGSDYRQSTSRKIIISSARYRGVVSDF